MTIKGENILLVQEEGQEKLGLVPALTSAKANVFHAKNLTKALWYVDGARFALIVVATKGRRDAPLDIARAIRANPKGKATPIALICEASDADFIKSAGTLGVAAIVTPPFEPKELLDKLANAIKPAPKGPTFDVRLINCFIDAIREVMAFYLGDGAQVGKPGIKAGPVKGGDFVTSLIAFNGQGQMGSMALAFDHKSIDAMAGRVFAQPGVALDAVGIADLAGELANQVLGKTKANFLKLGLKMQMGLPEVVVGENHLVHHKVQSPVIQVGVTHAEASCRMEFCVAAGTDEAIDEKESKDTVEGVVLF